MKTFKPFSDTALHVMLAGLSGQESFVFLESTRSSTENHVSYLFTDAVDRLVCNVGDDLGAFFRQAQERLNQGFFLAGYLTYEFGYLLEPSLAKSFTSRAAGDQTGGNPPIADLGVYNRPLIHDHLQDPTGGKKAWPAGPKPDPPENFTIDNLLLSLERQQYIEAVKRIKSYIANGDTYQVNFTLKLLFDFAGSIPEFYSSLRRNQSVSYSGLLKNGETTILTFSPELFFRKKGNRIDVRPMKGTMLRGRTNGEDRKLVEFLHNDIKNRSENVMIVDLLRNDLGRLCRMGGVSVQSLFDVETYETLHQMTSSIRGELPGAVSLEEMFKALFPCGSVTGAPKIRTMEIIRELEAADRGVYTGAIGFIAPDGQAVFNVPIRTIVLQGNKGEMGIGSGIVWDSDPEGEWDECRLKGRFLTKPAPAFKLIETMLWHPGSGYWMIDLHLERLAASAHYFSYPYEPDKIKAALQSLADDLGHTGSTHNQRVRLTLSKSGELDISHSELPGNALPMVEVEDIMRQAANHDLPEVVFAGRATMSNSAFLYHKTTLRKLYDEERARLVDRGGYYEVLFVNEEEEITEGSYSNIFLQQGNRLITPPISCGLLAGVLRKFLLLRYPDIVIEKACTKKDVEQADAVFVGNSVRGLVRVQLAGNAFSGKLV